MEDIESFLCRELGGHLGSITILLQHSAQRTLLECFKDLIPEEEELFSDSSERSERDDGTGGRSLSPTGSGTGNHTSHSVNMSNWFDDLTDEDFCDL